MMQQKSKLHLVYYPVLFSSIGFTILYTLIHWLLFIKTGVDIPESIVRNWLPMVLAAVIVYLLIRPGIMLLQFPYSTTQRRWLYQLIALVAIATPAVMAQDCLTKSTGKLTKLETIAQFNPQKTTPYYQVKHFYIGQKQIAVEFTSETSGKFNSELTLTAWAVMPVFENMMDTLQEECSYWAAVKYSKTFINTLNFTRAITAEKDFSEECARYFSQTNFQKLTFLEYETNAYNLAKFDNAIRKSPIVRYKDAVMMVPHFEPFTERGKSDFVEVLITWAIVAVVFYLLLLVPALPEASNYKTY